MKLSLCIPTFNEAENLHYALYSAYDFVDEVIIIDATSTDNTREIAQSYGEKVKVFKVDNPPNFLMNKQRAIEKASGDWILQLDADEAVSPELKAEILELINRKDTVTGYYTPRKNWFLGRFLMKGGVYPDYVLRLYRREGAHFALKNVHENVIVIGEVGYTKEALLHYADPDFERYLMRWNRYTTFDAGLLVKEKKSLGVWDGIMYFKIKPLVWFVRAYFRHKGFMDGFPGFVFHLFSAIRFWAIYIKAWQMLYMRKVGK